MTTATSITFAAWIVVSIALFAKIAPRRAILISMIGGWLFLPIPKIQISGPLPDVGKATTVLAGILCGMLWFDRAAFLRFRPTWFDVPMLVWVLSPFLSSVTNGLGLYDGLSAVLENGLTWGIPYWLGRIYFYSAEGLHDLAWGFFLGGLVYVPLCWFEILNGPYLQFAIYGVHPDAVTDAFRFGGWRPIIFMAHGLMVALWMTVASVCAIVLYLGGMLARCGRWLGAAAVLVLVATTFALKSVNAWLLLSCVMMMLPVSMRLQRAWLIRGTIALVLVYLFSRVSGLWYAFEVATLVEAILPGKKDSVIFRFVNEIQIAERAWLQPLWGWGRWGRAYIGREGGLSVLTPDSVWIAAFGEQGAVGLLAILGVIFLPPLLFSLRVSPRNWLLLEIAPVTACAFVVLVVALDSLANAMFVPAYLVAAGGVVGWCAAARPAIG
jgi:hypothetical protein